MAINSTHVFLFSFLFVFGYIACMWADESVYNNDDTVDVSANFAGRSFTVIGDAKEGNVVFSPVSIWNAIGIAGLGADGKTLEEITEIMQLQSLEKRFPAIASIYAPNRETPDEMESNTSNHLPIKQDLRVFIKNGVKIDSDYLDVIKTIEGVTCEDWNTDNEPLSNFPTVKLDDSRLVVMSTLKFSSRWNSPFASIRSLPFHLGRDREVQVMFMVDAEQFFAVTDFGDSYGFSLDFVKEKPSHPEFSMIFIVPKEIDGISSIVKGISNGNLQEWIEKICKSDNLRSYELYLPRFTIDNLLELKEFLKSMGMPSAFGTDADFSKLSSGQPLSITNILHTAQIDVDEYGVEASAETAVFIGSIGLRRTPTIRLDRPFVYLIYDKSNKQVLFIGRCDNPVSPGTLVPSDDQPKLSETL